MSPLGFDRGDVEGGAFESVLDGGRVGGADGEDGGDGLGDARLGGGEVEGGGAEAVGHGGGGVGVGVFHEEFGDLGGGVEEGAAVEGGQLTYGFGEHDGDENNTIQYITKQNKISGVLHTHGAHIFSPFLDSSSK